MHKNASTAHACTHTCDLEGETIAAKTLWQTYWAGTSGIVYPGILIPITGKQIVTMRSRSATTSLSSRAKLHNIVPAVCVHVVN